MCRKAGALFVATLVGLGGCDLQRTGPTMSSEPHPRSIRAAVPEADFRLSAEQRARLNPGFDVAALERLLARVEPEHRSVILSCFVKPEPDTPRPGMLTQIKDPELQALLDEVWAPVWDHVGASDAELQKNELGLPGRDLAIQRRAQASLDQNSNATGAP